MMSGVSEQIFGWNGRLNLPRLPRYVPPRCHSHAVVYGVHDSDVIDMIAM